MSISPKKKQAILDRKIARQNRHMFYDGMPCINGHGTLRYVSNNVCKTCVNEHNVKNKQNEPTSRYSIERYTQKIARLKAAAETKL
jgi:hypothetical protein